MAFGIVDTPQTDFADRTRLNPIAELDITTENSIPSPTKEGNDLLKQIRGMRQPAIRTPKHRAPFADRRNVLPKPEFTPLLKSAAKNNLRRTSIGKENGVLQTPAGLKPNYTEGSSPALPFNSSIMIDEHTGNSNDTGDIDNTPLPLAASTSSALSTPLAIRPHGGEGVLDSNGNIATLKEQEWRLQELDKENFSLKLKIHFLEEAMRKSGKEFNEAALRENTELKVEKITMQRDLKHLRKLLSQAERDLEDSRRRLIEAAENSKGRHATEGFLEDIRRLRTELSQKDDEIEHLRQQVRELEGERSKIQDLRDEVEDLQADLREREDQLDAKDDEIDKLKQQSTNNEDHDDEIKDLEETIKQQDAQLQSHENVIETLKKQSEGQDQLKGDIANLKDALSEKEEDLKSYQDALRTAASETEQKLREKDRRLELKEDEIKDLEDQLRKEGNDQSVEIRHKQSELDDKERELDELRRKLSTAHEITQLVEPLREELESLKTSATAEKRSQARVIEEKDFEIHALQRKLEGLQDEGQQDDEKLQAEIENLEYENRQKQNSIDDALDEIDELKQRLQKLETEADAELLDAQDRIQELETQQERSVKELQALRNSTEETSEARRRAADESQKQVRVLEDELEIAKAHEQQLQQDISTLRTKSRDLEARELRSSEVLKTERDDWNDQKKAFRETQARSDGQIASLQRHIDTLQKAQGNSTSQEAQLQQLLESERKQFAELEASLRRTVELASDNKASQSSTLTRLQSEVTRVNRALAEAQDALAESEDKVRCLEDEIEILDSTEQENAKRLQEELRTARQESSNLKTQLSASQRELTRAKTDLEKAQSSLRSAQESVTRSPRQTPSPQRDMQRQIRDLQSQLTKVKNDRESLQTKLNVAESAQADTKNDLDTLQFNLQSHTGTNAQLQQKLQDFQSQLAIVKKERQRLQDSLASTNSEYSSLEASLQAVEVERDDALKLSRELRSQLQFAQRDAERKLQSRVLAYEQEIQNLEQDLIDAQATQNDFEKRNDAAEQTIGRLKIKIGNLEQALSSARSKRESSSDTSSDERQDLHEMLKDAKLETEDLQLQITEREARIAALTSKQASLRDQLQRIREERAAQAARANSVTADLNALQDRHDALAAELDSLRQQEDQAQPSKLTSFASKDSTADHHLKRRHAAELRGLVRQIEYLAARCKREEKFRADLKFTKAYFTKVVEMHAKCNAVDLQLVNAMGIATDEVLAAEQRKARQEGPGRVALQSSKRHGPRSRPTLRVVGLTVLAGVRMQAAARGWAKVRESHDGLMKKLGDLRRAREDSASVSRDVSVSVRRGSALRNVVKA